MNSYYNTDRARGGDTRDPQTPPTGSSPSLESLKLPVRPIRNESSSSKRGQEGSSAGVDSTGLHLREISSYRLLTRLEEIQITAERDAARAGYYRELLGSSWFQVKCFDKVLQLVRSGEGYAAVVGVLQPSNKQKAAILEKLNFHVPTITSVLSKIEIGQQQLASGRMSAPKRQRLATQVARLQGKAAQLLIDCGLAKSLLFEVMQGFREKVSAGQSLEKLVRSRRASSEKKSEAREELAALVSELGESMDEASRRLAAAKGFQNKEEEATRKLVVCNMRLVFSIARKHHMRSGIPVLDLVQMGYPGLIKASETYDSSVGAKFSTHAFWWIRQAMGWESRNFFNPVSLSPHMQGELARYHKAVEYLVTSTGAIPDDQSVYRCMVDRFGSQLKAKDFSLLVPFAGAVSSLDGAIFRDSQKSAASLVASRGESTLDSVIDDTLEADKTRLLTRALAHVEAYLPRVAQILRMRFGLDTDAQEGLTLRDVGEHFRVTKERVRQLERKGLDRIRQFIMTDPELRSILEDLLGDLGTPEQA